MHGLTDAVMISLKDRCVEDGKYCNAVLHLCPGKIRYFFSCWVFLKSLKTDDVYIITIKVKIVTLL